MTLDGVVSRRLPDRALGRRDRGRLGAGIRSPTKMMQELIGAFPAKRAPHFPASQRRCSLSRRCAPRPFQHDTRRFRPSIAAILARSLAENPGINRKQLLEKLPPNETDEPEAAEKEETRARFRSALADQRRTRDRVQRRRCSIWPARRHRGPPAVRTERPSRPSCPTNPRGSPACRGGGRGRIARGLAGSADRRPTRQNLTRVERSTPAADG